MLFSFRQIFKKLLKETVSVDNNQQEKLFYGNYWLDTSGNFLSCKLYGGHEGYAHMLVKKECLTNQVLEQELKRGSFDYYRYMYKKRFIRVNNSNALYFYYNPEISMPVFIQLDALKTAAMVSNKKLIHDHGNNHFSEITI